MKMFEHFEKLKNMMLLKYEEDPDFKFWRGPGLPNPKFDIVFEVLSFEFFFYVLHGHLQNITPHISTTTHFQPITISSGKWSSRDSKDVISQYSQIHVQQTNTIGNGK